MKTNRTSFSPVSPYREKRPASSKLIFIVCEGAATEIDYFQKVISDRFENIKTKVQVINIHYDILLKKPKDRTDKENKILNSSNPKNFLEKMNKFISEKKRIYEFTKHDDEFWLIMDVDKHTSEENIESWNQVLDDCDEKMYKYAISNPFFELWLLLHHDDVNTEDFKYAVTENHSYEKTSHFRDRLRYLGVSLKNQKHIRNPDDYTKDKIMKAVERAESLDKSGERYPTNLGSTIYKLIKLLVEYNNSSE